MHDYYTKLVVIARLVTHQQFMHEINDFDLQTLADNYIYAYKNEREIGRDIAYCEVLPYLSKANKNKNKQQLFPLITDDLDINELKQENAHNITDEQIEMLDRMSEASKGFTFKDIEFEG